MLSVITGTALCWLEHGASSASQCDRDAAHRRLPCASPVLLMALPLLLRSPSKRLHLEVPLWSIHSS